VTHAISSPHKRHRPCALAVLIAAFMIVCGECVPFASAEQQPDLEPRANTVEFGRSVLLKDQPEKRFNEVANSPLSPAIRSQVNNYFAFYLSPEAQPLNDPKFTTRTFSAAAQSQNDLVEYRWTYSGVPLRAAQSLNALRIEIPVAAHANAVEMKALVESIVKTQGVDIEGREYEVRLQWPDALADGVQFSSNPAANILTLLTWHDRIDAFVEGKRLSILIYKKIPQLAGYQDGSKWFEKYSAEGASSRSDLARLYQRYFEAKDETKLQGLVYWASVQEAARQGFVRSVRFDLGHRLKSVEFVPLNRGEKLEYSKDGVVFRPSLPPVGRLVATYEGSGKLQRLTTSYLVGVKDGHYYITLASPASNP
jgi:hypothetical protein